MSDNILKIQGLKVAYGGIKAVKGIDLEVNKGELVTLIGANGAGKSNFISFFTLSTIVDASSAPFSASHPISTISFPAGRHDKLGDGWEMNAVGGTHE